MGFKNNLDYNRITHDLYAAGIELRSSYNDGFTQWELKKDLYKIKWLIDSILEDSPTFEPEEQFLKEYTKKVVWRKLTT